MIAWLLKILGISDEVVGNFSQAELRWGHGELAAIGLALLVPTAWFIVRRQRLNLPHVAPRTRQALSACRIGVLLLLVMVLGAPYLHTDETLDLKPVVALVIDDSASMALAAGPFEPGEARALANVADVKQPSQADGTAAGSSTPSATTPDDAADLAWRKRLNAMSRADLLAAVLRTVGSSALEPLAEKFDLKVYRVARHVRPTTLSSLVGDVKQPPLAESETSETDLGQAIRQAVDEAQGRKIAGIVLATDGRSTTGPDPIALARSLIDLSPDGSPAPIFSVPVGSEHPAPDVSVIEVSAPPQVAKDDTVSVAATLSSQGFSGHKATVELHDGDGPALSSQEITLSGARRQTVQFNYNATQVGARLLRATVLPLPDETVASNNSATATVRVGLEPAKLLYLEGIARWDFRFLDHALRRDKAMATTFVVESQLEADGVPAAIMPETAGLSTLRSKWAEYHVVMLGDISPALLPEEQQKALVAAVEDDGLGLIVQCGNRHMPWDFIGGPLAAILPMTFDEPATKAPAETMPSETTSPDEVANPQPTLHGLQAPAFAPFRMIVTPTGAMHPAFAVSGNASQDRGLWSQMPEFFWAAAGSKLKPGATRLADIEMAGGKDKLPILAEQVVGRGRVMVVGCDETFRWRRNVGDRIFYRFWGQSLRHVARKQAPDGQLSWLEVQPQSVEPGTPVTIDLYAVDESNRPLTQQSVSVAVGGQSATGPSPKETAAKETVKLERVGEAGYYRGSWTPEALGVVNVEYDGGRQPTLSAALDVANSHRELAQPDVDRETLATLAEISGGEMIELPELVSLPGRLAGETVHQQRPYEDDLWDNWLTLLLLAGLYCTDVGIRRVLGLI